jgi:hypothetical protein
MVECGIVKCAQVAPKPHQASVNLLDGVWGAGHVQPLKSLYDRRFCLHQPDASLFDRNAWA